MIKTITPVSYDYITPSLTAIIFAKISNTSRNDEAETYTLSIQEWIEIPYSMEVPDGNGVVILENFVTVQTVRNHSRVMTFAESDVLTAGLDQMYTITETGAYRRKKYTELGHLLINNSENVREVSWELV
jgi:hypothetical protein